MLALIVPFLVSLWIDVLWAGDHKGPPTVHSTALAPTGDEKAAHGAGQRYLSGREGRRSETALPLPDTVTNSALLPTPPMFNGALVGVTSEAVPLFRTFWFSSYGVSDFVP